MSVLIVLMKNDYDVILKWPFPYKISLRLINQSVSNDNQRDVIHFVSPDPTSVCFQRPRGSMNQGYGIKKFFPIEIFEQSKSQYVQDDTIFIESKIDFNEDSSFPSSAGGSPNDEEHVDMINEDKIQLINARIPFT